MLKNIKRVVALIVSISFLVSCAPMPSKITPAYVSPLTYENYSCKQLNMELYRVEKELAQVSGQQQSAANKDALAMGVGMVLFWPALFFLAGSDKKDEVARLKGEYEALRQAKISKGCP